MSSQPEPSMQPFKWHYAEFDDSSFQIRGRTLFFIVVLFSVILLVGLLFLYARWVCRFDPPPPARIQLPLPPSLQLQGLDAATIASLPIVLHKDSMSDGECCICLGIFADGDKVKLLPPCQHCFHSECVDKWLLTQSSCPLCRSSIRVDSPV
ncbi:RING-H2 finger protein ATL66-like [Salvia divinorum]|uniref:RING-H2 finger protein ATL66-like n=1 Tax=Salvia divinorum TaxID=28513 RepID=A0ABD1GPD3_SALDI